MFFSARELFNYVSTTDIHMSYITGFMPASDPVRNKSRRQLTFKEVKKCLEYTRRQIVTREGHFPHKWLRPWDVVPHLKNFRAPEGDFGIGIEIEYGFNTTEDFQYIANKIKDWKYIAMDYEGDHVPLETTFQPTLYSQFGPNSQAMRYLYLLKREEARLATTGINVGTHVNVSCSVPMTAYGHRVGPVLRYTALVYHSGESYINSGTVNGCLLNLTREEKLRYFNREPYGYIDKQPYGLEFKLFHSEPDPKQLVKYVEVSVALQRLLIDTTTPITMSTVRAACEAGYQLACKKTKLKPEAPVWEEPVANVSALEEALAA